MKANELRIGNLVKNKNGVVTIKVIDDNKDKIGFACHWSWPIYDYEPIPLTEEWLLKFGFKGGDLDFKGGALRVDIENSEIGIFIGSKDQLEIHMDYDHIILPRDIQYVHQLQNLYFALTGEELKVIN